MDLRQLHAPTSDLQTWGNPVKGTIDMGVYLASHKLCYSVTYCPCFLLVLASPFLSSMVWPSYEKLKSSISCHFSANYIAGASANPTSCNSLKSRIPVYDELFSDMKEARALPYLHCDCADLGPRWWTYQASSLPSNVWQWFLSSFTTPRE